MHESFAEVMERHKEGYESEVEVSSLDYLSDEFTMQSSEEDEPPSHNDSMQQQQQSTPQQVYRDNHLSSRVQNKEWTVHGQMAEYFNKCLIIYKSIFHIILWIWCD